MTPCIDSVRKTKIHFNIHEYSHDPSISSYGNEASEKLGVAKEKVFKTLVISLANEQMVVGVVPVAARISMKLIAKAAGAKKAQMADPSDVERVTGYVLGGVSPLGQKKRLKTFIDSSAERNQTIFVSAGRRGLEIELCPDDLKTLVQGEYAEIC